MRIRYKCDIKYVTKQGSSSWNYESDHCFFCRALKSGNNKTNPTEKQEHYKNNNKNRPMAKRIVHIKPSITFYDSGHDYRKEERDGDKE